MFESENITQIIVTTPNTKVLEYLQDRHNEDNLILDSRPLELARVNTYIDDTIQYLFDKYNFSTIDTVSIVNYEYPLRKSFYIDKAINTLYLFEADSVISVNQENANFYLHKGKGLKPFTSNNDLRLERDFIYKEAGGIHTTKVDSFIANGKMMSAKSTHIILDEKSSKPIATEDDFEYLEYLYSKGFKND